MRILAALAISVITAAPLTRAQLEFFTFDLGPSASVEGGKVPLVNGRWSDADGGSTFSLHPTYAIGDLDNDGNSDAVAILVESAGGTGTFLYMFALMNRGGQPVQLGEPQWLGDRTVIERLTIDRRGVISLRHVTHRERDPSCCPTLRMEDRYRVENGQLMGILK